MHIRADAGITSTCTAGGPKALQGGVNDLGLRKSPEAGRGQSAGGALTGELSPTILASPPFRAPHSNQKLHERKANSQFHKCTGSVVAEWPHVSSVCEIASLGPRSSGSAARHIDNRPQADTRRETRARV
jgi:hypothetical protein